MALCLVVEPSPTAVAAAVLADGVYSCTTGTHLLLTVAEVNASLSLPLAPEHVAKAYGWGLGTVLMLWAIGWAVGVFVGVIRRA